MGDASTKRLRNYGSSLVIFSIFACSTARLAWTSPFRASNCCTTSGRSSWSKWGRRLLNTFKAARSPFLVLGYAESWESSLVNYFSVVPQDWYRRHHHLLHLHFHHSCAFSQVEHVIREENVSAAYDILELFCEFVLARVPILETQRWISLSGIFSLTSSHAALILLPSIFFCVNHHLFIDEDARFDLDTV